LETVAVLGKNIGGGLHLGGNNG